jgi:SRSO17 transposase
VRQQRIELIKLALKEREIILCIDETGDKKKGKSTDYVARQYIGNLGKTENGIVSIDTTSDIGRLLLTRSSYRRTVPGLL